MARQVAERVAGLDGLEDLDAAVEVIAGDRILRLLIGLGKVLDLDIEFPAMENIFDREGIYEIEQKFPQLTTALNGFISTNQQ